MEIYGFDPVAANNDDAPPNGFPENMAYGEVNDAARELMASIARWRSTAFATTLTTAGTQPAYTLTTPHAFTGFTGGEMVSLTAHATSTGAITLAVDGQPAGAVVDHTGTQIGAGGFQANGRYVLIRRGTGWQLISGAVQAASETAAGVVELATNAEALTGTDTARALTAANLKHVTDNRQANFSGLYGTVTCALNADIYAAATGAKVITAQKLEEAMDFLGLVDAATIAMDWDTGINRLVVLTANRQLGTPTNGQRGTWRTVYVVGNDATPRTLTFSGNFLGDVPVINDITASRAYLLTIMCVSAGTHFIVSAKRAT